MGEPFDASDEPELHVRNLRVLEALLFLPPSP